jgi:hypothetical protein
MLTDLDQHNEGGGCEAVPLVVSAEANSFCPCYRFLQWEISRYFVFERLRCGGPLV